MSGGAGRPHTGSTGESQSKACTEIRFVCLRGPSLTSGLPKSCSKRSALWRQFSRASWEASVATTEQDSFADAIAKEPTPQPAPSSTTRLLSKSLCCCESHLPSTTAAAHTPNPVRSVAPLPSPRASVLLSAIGSSRIRIGFSPSFNECVIVCGASSVSTFSSPQ